MRDVSELIADIQALPQEQQVDLLRKLDAQLGLRENRSIAQEPATDSILDKPRTWTPFEDILKTILQAKHGDWRWYQNTRCKYVELRIDMRDQCALIRDREGNLISLEQLQYQYTA